MLVFSHVHMESLQTSVGKETVKGTRDTARYWERKLEEMEVIRTRELTISNMFSLTHVYSCLVDATKKLSSICDFVLKLLGTFSHTLEDTVICET